MKAHWADTPPVHLALAGILGYGRKGGGSIEEAAEFIPVAAVAKDEFDKVLQSFGLPVDDVEVEC